MVYLKPEFKVHKDGSVKTQTVNTRKDVGSACEPYCEPIRKNWFCRDLDKSFWWLVANVIKYEVWVYQANDKYTTLIDHHSGNINANGRVDIWDLTTNMQIGGTWITDVFYLT